MSKASGDSFASQPGQEKRGPRGAAKVANRLVGRCVDGARGAVISARGEPAAELLAANWARVMRLNAVFFDGSDPLAPCFAVNQPSQKAFVGE